MEYITVSTFVQASFWLEKGEILTAIVEDDSLVFVSHLGSGWYEMTYQPDYGARRVFRGNKKNLEFVLEKLFSEGRVFIVVEGAQVQVGNLRLIDSIFDWFRRKFKRK